METDLPDRCGLCPRRCGAARRPGQPPGRCHGGDVPLVARAAPHHWEEPCISGSAGSGTVFFGGCPLGCLFCQNRAISHQAAGRPVEVAELAEIFLALQAQGVHNLNLVTAGHWRPWVLSALARAGRAGLRLPVVWNTGGYETLAAVAELSAWVDVWLFDLKFHSPALAGELAGAPDYFETAFAALSAALEQTGPPVFGRDGLLQKGVVLRILVLPGQVADAVALLEAAAALGPEKLVLSLMSQYTPPGEAPLLARLPKPLRRPLSSYEYKKAANRALALASRPATSRGGRAPAPTTPRPLIWVRPNDRNEQLSKYSDHPV